MRIYLGGASAEIDRVLAFRDLLVNAGHTITEPWWERIEEARRCGWKSDAEVPHDFKAACTDRNLRGIETADRTVVLAKAAGGFSSGAAGEIGYALARSLVYAQYGQVEPMLQRFAWCSMPPILVGNTNGYILGPRCVCAHTPESALGLLSRV